MQNINMSSYDRIQSITAIRLKIDTLLNSFNYLLSSREVSLAKTSLQFSFAWLGESLKELGSKSPYLDSENPTSDNMEVQADHTENSLLQEFEKIDQTQTARVKLFRAKLTEIISEIEIHKKQYMPFLELNQKLGYSIKAATEAKFSFGWELGRIREIKESESKTGTSSYPTSAGNLPL